MYIKSYPFKLAQSCKQYCYIIGPLAHSHDESDFSAWPNALLSHTKCPICKYMWSSYRPHSK